MLQHLEDKSYSKLREVYLKRIRDMTNESSVINKCEIILDRYCNREGHSVEENERESDYNKERISRIVDYGLIGAVSRTMLNNTLPEGCNNKIERKIKMSLIRSHTNGNQKEREKLKMEATARKNKWQGSKIKYTRLIDIVDIIEEEQIRNKIIESCCDALSPYFLTAKIVIWDKQLKVNGDVKKTKRTNNRNIYVGEDIGTGKITIYSEIEDAIKNMFSSRIKEYKVFSENPGYEVNPKDLGGKIDIELNERYKVNRSSVMLYLKEYCTKH